MPATYSLIASNTLGSDTGGSIQFTNIPSNYTDLVLKASVRNDDTGVDNAILQMRLNSDSATNYSLTYVRGNGSTAASGRDTSQTYLNGYYGVNGGLTTSNSFSSIEIYIPSYNASQNKPISLFPATETNSTGAYIAGIAGLWRNTSAVTSITLSLASSSFKANSSFFLYGIKNS